MTNTPSSLLAAVRYFSELKVCNDYMRGIKCRFNNRKTDDGERFANVMGTVTGRRVTWRQLTAQDGCGFMGLE